MIHVLKTEYWSRADAFLLPLSGLSKDKKFGMKSYMFWNEHSIYDYKLTISFSTEKYDELAIHCKKHVFPTLDKKCYLMENYDMEDKSIFVLDLSEWASDIQLFLAGKYSKFSDEAKRQIERFHTYDKDNIPIHVYAVLHPNMPMELLDDMSPIEYICQEDTYKLNYDIIKKMGEIGSLYESGKESLLTNEHETCKIVS